MLDIVIIGAGGFGGEIYLYAKDCFPSDEFRIKGFLDDNPGRRDNFRIDAEIISGIDTYTVEENDRFLIGIGDLVIKERLVTQLKRKGAQFISLIHPTSYIAVTAKIGEGVVICPFCFVANNSVIDDYVMMNIYSSSGHDVRIGKYSILSPYATVNGFSTLEDKVFIGTHATVTGCRKIGYKATIGANSLVLHDVPPGALVYGVPAKNKKISV